MSKSNTKITILSIVSGGIGFCIGQSSLFTSSTTTSDKVIDEEEVKRSSTYTSSSTLSSNTNQSSTNYQDSVYSTIFNENTQLSYSDLARRAHSSSKDLDNHELLKLLVSEWAKEDPYRALDFSKELDRIDLISLSLQQLGTKQPAEGLEWIQNNITNLTTHAHLMTAVFVGMSENDPAGAVSMASNLEESSQKDQIMSVIIDQWAKKDVGAVFSWLENSELTQQTPNIYDQVVRRYIADSPVDAAKLVIEMEEGDAKANFASNIAFEMAKNDINQGLEWAETLSGDNREFALSGVLENWASQETGISALDYVFNLTDEPNYNDLFTKVSFKLSQSNPEALELRISDLPEYEKNIAARQLGQVYGSSTPNKAVEWINSLESGKTKDEAIQGSLSGVKNNNISKAFELTESLSTESQKLKHMESIMKEWVKVDQFSAEQAIQTTTSISQEQKELMLKSIYQKVTPRTEYLIPPKN